MLSWKEDSMIRRIETGRQGCKIGENRRKEQNEEQKEKNKRNNEKTNPSLQLLLQKKLFKNSPCSNAGAITFKRKKKKFWRGPGDWECCFSFSKIPNLILLRNNVFHVEWSHGENNSWYQGREQDDRLLFMVACFYRHHKRGIFLCLMMEGRLFPG